MAYNQTTRGLTSLYAIVSAEATDSEHPSHEEFADRYRSTAQRAADLLRAGQEAGEVRDDIDPALAARLISAVMDGIQLQWLLDESRRHGAALRGVRARLPPPDPVVERPRNERDEAL